MTFHARRGPVVEGEGPVTQAWQVEPAEDGGGVTKLSVITSGMRAGSEMERQFTGGLPFILSGLKSFLETGAPMAA